MSVEESMAELARLAAEADHAEGGHRIGANVAALLAWGSTVRAEHGDCGQLQLETTDHGGAAAVICPLHGRIPAPEWKGRA